jgi:signal transduction histidine kinase
MVSLATPMDDARTDIDVIVSAVAVPVLVADYTALIERFAGIPGPEVEALFRRDSATLMECLPLARAVAASPEWIRLYGSPLADRAPDLLGRKFTPEDYPELHESLIRQFTAPMMGIDSVVSEHTAPTMSGDVIVRSHWKASKLDGQTAYQRVVVVDLDVTHLRRTQRHLEETLESKDRFIATVGHELRNPMTSLIGFGSLLHTDWALLDDTARREMVAIIADQSRDVAGLLDDLITSAVGDSLRVVNEPLRLGQMLSSLDLSGLDTDLDP